MVDSNPALEESKTHSEPPCYNNKMNNNSSSCNLLRAYLTPGDVLTGLTGTFSSNPQNNPMSQVVLSPFLLTLKLRFRKGSHLTEDWGSSSAGTPEPTLFLFPLHSLRRGLSSVFPHSVWNRHLEVAGWHLSTYFHFSLISSHTQRYCKTPGPASGTGLEVGNCILEFNLHSCPVRQLFPSFSNRMNEAGKLSNLQKSHKSGRVLTRKGRKLEEEINMYLTPRICLWVAIVIHPILQMRKLTLREMKPCAHGHTTGNSWV